MPLKESGEMYLESIYILSQRKAEVHSIDIAEYMNYSKPSVSRGVGILKQKSYINVDKEGHITLTEPGKAAAEKLFERHTVLTDILKRLGVEESLASEDACRIEHVISDSTFFAIKNHFENQN